MSKFRTLSITASIVSIPFKAFNSHLRQGLLNLIRNGFIIARPALEFLIASVGLILLVPLFITISILIKVTSRGPLFYAQERVGKDGSIFEIIKFRTMSVDAESLPGYLWSDNNDERTTYIGRVLRRTRIDELPQLLNVIRGEMSIIGPRPERPFFVKELESKIPGYVDRLTIKPGITGLAQCLQRSEETIRDVQKKLRYDMLYIKRKCLTLDIKIILQTLSVSIQGGSGRRNMLITAK